MYVLHTRKPWLSHAVQGAYGHLFALYLLTEFQATKSLPVILEAVSLPGDGPFELFGDAITEDLSRMLAALATETPEVLDELIANRSLNEYVRWEAAQTFLHWVGDGRLTRDEAVARLRCHLREAIADEDSVMVEGLVSELVLYSPHEALPEIQEAYRRDLVPFDAVRLEKVERSVAAGSSHFQKELERRSPSVQDTVAELRGWASFREVEHVNSGVYETPASLTRIADYDNMINRSRS